MEGWTFLTNHGHVLLSIAQNPEIRLRDVADKVGITERAAQRIVADLIEAGYLSSTRVGRRNRYKLYPSQPLRHPIEQHCQVQSILNLVAPGVKASASGANRYAPSGSLTQVSKQKAAAEPAALPRPRRAVRKKGPRRFEL